MKQANDSASPNYHEACLVGHRDIMRAWALRGPKRAAWLRER